MQVGNRTLALMLLGLFLPAGIVRAQMGSGSGEGPPVALGSGSRMIEGTVTAVAPELLTLKTESGEVFKVAVSANTQVRKNRTPEKLADVHPGDGVGAMGELDRPNHTVHALMLFVVDAEQIRKARENLGKTYIAGRVTAINADDLKITILRSDGVTQTIGVDEGTSFRRGGRGMQQAMLFGFGGQGAGGQGSGGQGALGQGGGRQGSGAQTADSNPQGESITLADIKTGDLIGGQGALRNGIFIPTDLTVAPPGARGGRRRGGEGAGPGRPAAGGSDAHPAAGSPPQGLR